MFRKKKQGKRLYNKNIQQGGDAIYKKRKQKTRKH